jgi:hypothetical protein
MPAFDFDSEYSGPEEEAAAAEPATSPAGIADRLVANLSAPLEEDAVDDDYMGEVDKRLEVTTYYRELLRGSLFGVDTEASRVVEKEVRRFVRDRVEILLGIRADDAPKAPPFVLPFSEQEVEALKLLAARLIANPSIARPASEKKPEPTVRQASAPVTKAPPTIVRRPPRPLALPVVTAPAARPDEPKSKRGARAQAVKKTVVNPETGKAVEITKPRVQRPAGALPFPSPQEMEAITAQQASHAVSLSAQGRTGTVELVTAALKETDQS